MELSTRLKARTFLFLVLLLIQSSIACAEKKRVAQESRDLAATITRSLPTPTRAPNATNSTDEKRVYLDASLSMKGFVNITKRTTFDELLDAIGDAMPGCQLFKYGQRRTEQPEDDSNIVQRVDFGLELHRPEFYDLSYNPDDQLIDSLTRDDKPAFSVLVSDGVYSEARGATSPPVVQAIQNWMQRGRSVGILVFKSSFSGPFYSEHKRAFLPTISVEARPFYAFVFSPTENDFWELREKLRKRFPDMGSILFSDNSVSCIPVLNEHMKGMYSIRKPPEVPYYWQMFDLGLFAQEHTISIGYGMKCFLSPEYPASEFKLDTTSEYYRWESSHFKKVESGPPLEFLIQASSDKESAEGGKEKQGVASASPVPQPSDARNSELEDDKKNKKVSSSTRPDLILTIPKDPTSDYSFYRIRLTPSPKFIRQDIQDLSTRDDGERTNANKTFRFYELINALTDIHFKNRLMDKTYPPLFITVTNR